MEERDREERRNVDRRITQVDEKVNELGRKVDINTSELAHISKMMDAQFSTVGKGQDLLIMKLDALKTGIDVSLSEPEKSSAGRELMRDISELRRKHDEDMVTLRSEFAREIANLIKCDTERKASIAENTRDIDDLESERDRLQGALNFLRNWNLGAVGLGIGTAIFFVIMWLKGP